MGIMSCTGSTLRMSGYTCGVVVRTRFLATYANCLRTYLPLVRTYLPLGKGLADQRAVANTARVRIGAGGANTGTGAVSDTRTIHSRPPSSCAGRAGAETSVQQG